jgi:heptosyltransferase-2
LAPPAPSPAPPRRALALHFGALGDFVLSWPALGLLMAGPPASELHVVGAPAWGELILPPERVHDRESARLARLFTMEPAGEADEWLKGFARAVVFTWRPGQAVQALLAHLRLAGVGEVWTVPTRPGPGQRLHAGQLQVQALRARGLSGPAQTPPPRLEPSVTIGPAIIAPGSGGAAKRLGPGLAARLAARLAEAYGPPLLVLGPAEAGERDPAWRRELETALAGVPHRVIDSPGVAALARALMAAPAYVGADSGVTHLAAALGAPTLAVFQASDPAIWAPRGARVRVCGPGEAEAVLDELLAENC